MKVVADFPPKEEDGPMAPWCLKPLPTLMWVNIPRVFSGKFKSDQVVYNSKEKNEKIGNVLVRGKTPVQTDVVPCGDLAVVVNYRIQLRNILYIKISR